MGKLRHSVSKSGGLLILSHDNLNFQTRRSDDLETQEFFNYYYKIAHLHQFVKLFHHSTTGNNSHHCLNLTISAATLCITTINL